MNYKKSCLCFYGLRITNEKEDKLKEHPEMCPNCGEDAVTYERIALEHGEYVCDECDWDMNVITGEITNKGENNAIFPT